MAFPATLEDLSTTRANTGSDKLSAPDHLAHHVAEDTLVEALQAKVGVDASAVVTSLDFLLKNEASINPGHLHNVLAALDGVPAQAVYVDAAGQVGIGTTAPETSLHIVSANGGSTGSAIIESSNTTNTTIHLKNTSSGAGTWELLSAGSAAAVGVGKFSIYSQATATHRLVIDSSGNVGIGTTIPTAKIDINSDKLRLRTAKTPATAGAAGNQGDLCWDADFIYICVATNTWKKVAIVTW